MAGTPLNRKNLLSLGAEALADLLLEAVKGDAARQRKLRMALSARQSPREAAADVRKRLAQIRKASNRLSRKAQRTLARELTELVEMVDRHVAPQDTDTAFDLLWSILHLAPAILARTDDGTGTIAAVMDEAMAAIARLAPRLEMDAQVLADTVFDALTGDEHGAFHHATTALGEALGEPGRARLKARAEAVIAAARCDADQARHTPGSDESHGHGLARDRRDRTARTILRDIADLEGDVDAWLACHTTPQLTFHTIAPQAAQRLLAAGRPCQALRIVKDCLAHQDVADRWLDMPDLDAAYLDCLEALGEEEALRAALHARFESRLCAPTLRRYLARLPDFDDDEALLEAQARVLAHPDIVSALAFCQAWPDPALAARLVLSRTDALDGEAYDILNPLADTLAPEHPLAAVLVWRAIILFALQEARPGHYRHAARHLASCAQTDAAIVDYAEHPDHHAFVAELREAHGRKKAFWSRVN
ncbi:DUF6880 family protein [Thetidibacter halocola]|uniref:Uncharacterized protein n=1 Tax=Thetidibacter halocola TaxID=2827239 RepID=A0A8J7WJI8_9RHOB|nr:DUF6880 family protein [Thetidibacter halocola]MBS0126801.1 hypothetical protein [Thetidibacter halocola]